MRSHVRVLACVLLLLALAAVPASEIYRVTAGRSRAVREGVERLGDDRFRVRERAQRLLVSLGAGARGALRTARESADPEVRHRAGTALAALDRAAEPLGARWEREFAGIVAVGIREPGGFRPDSSRLNALLLDRATAARAAVEVARAREDRPLEHQRAVRLLADLGRWESASYLAGLLRRGALMPSTLHYAAEGLLRSGGGEEVLDDLRAGCRWSGDPVSRAYCLKVLGVLGVPSDFSIALAAAGDAEPQVRREAAAALALLAGREAGPHLERLLEDPASEVRCSALEALGRLPGTGALKGARMLLRDPDPLVRAAAVQCLERRGTPRDLAGLRRRLDDSSPLVRRSAVAALVARGRVLEAASAGLRDPSPSVRGEALRAARLLPPDDRRQVLAGTPRESDPYLITLRRELLGP